VTFAKPVENPQLQQKWIEPLAYGTTYSGIDDFYMSKLTPDGSGLVFGIKLGSQMTTS
jgi:hypothetical protein